MSISWSRTCSIRVCRSMMKSDICLYEKVSNSKIKKDGIVNWAVH